MELECNNEALKAQTLESISPYIRGVVEVGIVELHPVSGLLLNQDRQVHGAIAENK